MEDLFAPFDFAIIKTEIEINSEKDKANERATLFFNFNQNIKKQVLQNFETKIHNTGKERAYNDSHLKKMEEFGVEQLNNIYKYGILLKSENLNVNNKSKKVVLLKNNIADDIAFNKIFSLNEALKTIDNEISFSEFTNDKIFLDEIFISVLQANVTFDNEKTRNVLNEELNKISPTRGFISKNTRIISKGDIVGSEALSKLNSLKIEYESKVLSKKSYNLILLGKIIKISLLIIMLMLFIYQFRDKIYEDDNKTTFVYFNLLMMVSVASVVIKYQPALLYIVPVSIVPIVLKSFFDSRLGLMTHIIIVILIAFMTQNAFEYVFIQISAGIITVLTVSPNHKRASMFIAVGLITFVYIISYFGYSIALTGDLAKINYMTFFYFIINGLLTLFSQPLIYLYEKTFKLVSDVSLLELSDTNNELLKALSDKAPGTFQHSLMVANIAESAANEIKANARLVRTGALYHDIGKMVNPLYFIENQQNGINPHDELSSLDSAKIITNHIKDGIEIAKKNNIPDRIIDFIRTHHGDSTIYYFYRQHMNDLPEDMIDETQFMYPGPKPYSKETAILMMADALEASSRTLKSYDSETINKHVNNIVSKQMSSNQFINSDITLREIEIVKTVITKKLMNIYHARIEYPD